MYMAGENTNIEKGSENHCHGRNMSSDWLVNGNNIPNTSIGVVDNSFSPPIWDQPINGQNLGYCDVNLQNDASLKGNMFPPGVNTMAPHSLPHFPADSGFIERAARFSCFGTGNLVEMMNPFSVANNLNPYSRGSGMVVQVQNDVFGGNISKSMPAMQFQRNEVNTSEVSKQAFKNDYKKSESLTGNESDDAEFSGRGGAHEELDGPAGESSRKGFGSKKRKRGAQGNEHNENDEAPQPSIETAKDIVEIKQKGDKKSPISIGKPGGKNCKQGSQGSDPPKEDYIHVRARRGQATNSHSLAERVRREKISERMKFLQDLVPGCSKVTGKAVMLDEIINYVQSLQRQVEFLSMKLATVNPRLDFNIDGFLAKDILQHRVGMSSSLAFPSDTTMQFPTPHHPSPAGLIQACLASNSSEALQRRINLQPIAISGGFKEPTSQVPSIWDDELHNIVHMGFNSSAPLTNQDLSGSLPLAHMKPEP